MSKEVDLQKDREAVIDSKLEVLEERSAILSDAVYRNARDKLLVRAGSVLSLVAVVAGLGGFAWIKYITNSIDELTNTLEAAKVDLAYIEETNARLIDGRLDEVLSYSLGAVTSRAMYCSKSDPIDSINNSSLRLEFTSEYSVGGDLEKASSFTLPHPGRALDIYIDPDVIPFDDTNCVRSSGAISLTNNATPSFRDLRELPSLDGFTSSEITVEFADGTPGDTAEIDGFRDYWRRVGPVNILIEIGRFNLHFVREREFFLKEEWLSGDERIVALNPVEFREHEYSSGTKVLRAFFLLREPAFLNQLTR